MAAQPKPQAVSIRTVGPFDLGRLSRLHEGGLARLDAMRGVGFSLCRVVRDESELLSIGVGASYRRRGVAGYLLRASMERARVIGARQMFLEVAVDNEAAQRLYLVHGFEHVGTRTDYYQRQNGERTAAYTMRCTLDARGGWTGNPA